MIETILFLAIFVIGTYFLYKFYCSVFQENLGSIEMTFWPKVMCFILAAFTMPAILKLLGFILISLAMIPLLFL